MKETLDVITTSLVEIPTDDVGEHVRQRLDGRGYLHHALNETTNEATRRDDLLKSDGLNYLVCLPHVAERIGLPT